MYPKVSPKFNMMQKTAIGVKKNSPKNRKKVSPKASKPRAQWNLRLEKSLVGILHEHNNEYYRGQNGWSSDTWNKMAKQFRAENTHVTYTKSQIQDKEKELKREYRMVKDARMQSGVGWCEESCKIQADDHLWDNLVISFPKIGKFKKNGFPLFDSLGELYDGQIADGTYNFTSTSDDAKDVVEVPSGSENDDLQDLHEVGPSQIREENTTSREVHVGEGVDKMKHNNMKVASGQKKKLPQESKKGNKSDEIVQVVKSFVAMKEKQADDEKAEANAYTIGKCISTLHKMTDFSREERVKASKIFKVAENRETFLSWAAEDEQLAVMWLRDELQELP